MKNISCANLHALAFVALAAVLTSCSLTNVKNFEYSHNHDGKLFYISENLRNSFSIPDFPADDSDEYYQDFKVLKGWQEQRTEEQCFAANSQEYSSMQELFPAYREFFNSLSDSDKYFLYRVYEDAHTINITVKSKFTRPRPFRSDPSLEPCANIGRIKGYAYPSGHATMSGVFEKMMLVIDPDNEKGIKDAAQRAGMYRVLAGLHHPSDIKAGYALGADIYEALKKNSEFNKKLNSLHEKYVKFKSAKTKTNIK